MSELIIDEVVFALRRQRDLYEANNATKEAALYDRYVDSLWDAVAVVKGATRGPDELSRIRKDVFAVSSPFLLERLLAFPRDRRAYPRLLKLGGQVMRVEMGLRPRRFLGLF